MASITTTQLAVVLAAAVPTRPGASRIPAASLAVLLALRARPRRVTELATLLGWPTATAVNELARVQGCGWVQDAEGSEDARVRLVELTARGQQALRSGRAAKARCAA
jgi:DNA-binding MarR family transcriptional regulator